MAIIENWRKSRQDQRTLAYLRRIGPNIERARGDWFQMSEPSSFDIGVLRIDDPRAIEFRTDTILADYDIAIRHLRRHCRTTRHLVQQQKDIEAYIRAHKKSDGDRVLKLHLPLRPDARTIIPDVQHARDQLAAWTEAHNAYDFIRPIRFIFARASQNIEGLAKQMGFVIVQPDHYPRTNVDDIIAQLIQREGLDPAELLRKPRSVILTTQSAFSNRLGIHTEDDSIVTPSGHTIVLPHPNNTWTLTLEGPSGSIPERSAQMLRGAIQRAALEAHEQAADVKINIRNPKAYQPFLDPKRPPTTVWNLYHQMGTPVERYGLPPEDYIAAILRP